MRQSSIVDLVAADFQSFEARKVLQMQQPFAGNACAAEVQFGEPGQLLQVFPSRVVDAADPNQFERAQGLNLVEGGLKPIRGPRGVCVSDANPLGQRIDVVDIQLIVCIEVACRRQYQAASKCHWGEVCSIC